MSSLEALRQALQSYMQPDGPEHGYSSPFNSTPRYPVLPYSQEVALGNYAVASNGSVTRPSWQWREMAQQDMDHAAAVQRARNYQNSVGDVYGRAAPGGYGVPDHVQPLPHSPVNAGGDKKEFLREQQQDAANHPDYFEKSLQTLPAPFRALARALHESSLQGHSNITLELRKEKRK